MSVDNTCVDEGAKPILVQGWPLVEVCFSGPADEVQVLRWLQQMDDLFARQAAFGLLTRTEAASDFSDSGRKAMGLWFKQRRVLLARWCVGVARIAMDEAAEDRMAGPRMQAAMPCPIYASVDALQARAWLQQQLHSALAPP